MSAAPASDRAASPPIWVGHIRRTVLRELDAATINELQVPAFLRRRDALLAVGEFLARDEKDIREDILANNDTERSVSEIAGVLTADLPKVALTSERIAEAPDEPRELLSKNGIAVETEWTSVDLLQATRQVSVLVSAFEEAADYDLQRHHNQPPPALWISNSDYLSDLRALLVELRKLNENLEAKLDCKPVVGLEKSTPIAMLAGKKFIESYADVMGKGAAALTVGAVAAMFVALGVDKGTVGAIWNLLKPGK